MKNNPLKFLYYVSIILAFLPMFVIFIIPKTSANYLVGYFVWIALLLLLVLFKNKELLIFLREIFHKKITQLHLVFIAVCAFTTLVHYIGGYYTAPYYFYLNRFIAFFGHTILLFYLPSLAYLLKIKINSITTFIYTLIFLIIFGGFVQYFAFLFNIDFICNIFDFLANWRTIRVIDNCREAMRVYSIFDEPARLAEFIFVVMPIIVKLCSSEYKLYKTNWLNFIVKQTMIPITLIVVILTKSPIYLILNFVELFILLIIQYKKYFKIILSCFFICIVIVNYVYWQFYDLLNETYIMRIISTLPILFDISNMVMIEPSLATRIISYFSSYIIFAKNIFWGVGLNNSEPYVNSIFLTIPIPKTPELIMNYYKVAYAATLNKSLFWTSLAEIGLIGTGVLYYFIFTCYKSLSHLKQSYKSKTLIFINGLQQSYFSLLIVGFYNLYILTNVLWFFLGLALLFVLHKKGKGENAS